MLSTLQLRSRWDNKLKASLFPGDVLKKSKQAKDTKDGEDRGRGGSQE
jgi:hypothetical protein